MVTCVHEKATGSILIGYRIRVDKREYLADGNPLRLPFTLGTREGMAAPSDLKVDIFV